MTGMPKKESSKLWNYSYIFLNLINTLNAFSFYLICTIMSKYLVGIGASIYLAGIIVGMFSITSLICRPFCGVMSDTLNKVKLMKISSLIMAIGLIGYAGTTFMPLIIAFRILQGIGFAIVSTSLVSLSTEYIPADRLGEGIGYLGLGQVFSSAVAPGVGISIANAFGMENTFITAGILVVISFFLLFAFHEGEKKVKRSEKIRISLKDIIALKALNYTMVASVFSFINGIIASYLVLYADEMHISGISIYFTVYAIILFLIRPISGKVMDKKGVKIIIIPAVIITALSMFLLGRAASLLFVLLTAVLRSAGQGAAQPALQAACIKKVGKEHSGVATSTYFLGGDIGQGIGPMLGGYLLGQIGYSSGYKILFDLCGILLIGVLVIFLIIERKRENKPAQD